MNSWGGISSVQKKRQNRPNELMSTNFVCAKDTSKSPPWIHEEEISLWKRQVKHVPMNSWGGISSVQKTRQNRPNELMSKNYVCAKDTSKSPPWIHEDEISLWKSHLKIVPMNICVPISSVKDKSKSSSWINEYEFRLCKRHVKIVPMN